MNTKVINKIFFFFSLQKKLGVINAEGLLWKDQRRFLHEKLRRFGMTHFSNNNNKLQNMVTVS